MSKEARTRIGKDNLKFRFHKMDMVDVDYFDNLVQSLPFYLIDNISSNSDQ